MQSLVLKPLYYKLSRFIAVANAVYGCSRALRYGLEIHANMQKMSIPC
jgi:hypothetical protein